MSELAKEKLYRKELIKAGGEGNSNIERIRSLQNGGGGGSETNVLIDYDLYSLFKDFKTKNYFLSPTKIKQLLVNLGIDITQPIQLNTSIFGVDELFGAEYIEGGELPNNYSLTSIVNNEPLIVVNNPTAPFTFETMLDTLAQQQNTALEINEDIFDPTRIMALSMWVFTENEKVCYSITKAQFISLFEAVDKPIETS